MLTNFGIGTLDRELVKANVKSKAPLKLILASGPLDSNIRKRAYRIRMRMLESDH